MSKIIQRLLKLNLPSNRSAFLWGPRKSGKSYWISHHLKQAPLIDLLQTDVYADYVARPSLLRERFQTYRGLVVIDEIQKVQALLDEVHWLVENSHVHFLMTWSSARKLKRGNANLLGGRAWKKQMMPLVSAEVDRLDLQKIVVSGLLPPHFLSPNPIEDLRAYVADYLKEEIAAEALTQNIPSFSDFLRVAALTSSELLNYANVARETGVSPKIVRNYFSILEDTYLGSRLPPWTKSKNRRLIETEKFYLFDVGVANFLSQRRPVLGNPDFGKSFEHFIFMELKAYQTYCCPERSLTYWRTSTGLEVDFIFGDKEVAIEVKSGKVHEGDLKGLKALKEDGPVKKSYIVSLEKEPRTLSGFHVLPWNDFLKFLWNGEI